MNALRRRFGRYGLQDFHVSDVNSSRRNFSIWAQLFCGLWVVGLGIRAKVRCVQSTHLTTHVRGERPFRLGPSRVGVCLEETMNRTIRYVLGAAVASVVWV